MEVKNMVKEGYNKIARQYYTYRDLSKFNSELERFSSLLPEEGKILDVGSGAGIPTARYLAEKGFQIDGIDISSTMVEMARENVPEGNFILGDITTTDFEKESYDGLISVYTLFHIPKSEHPQLFKKFHNMLKPNGILLINTGISESDSISKFFGVPMLWSNYKPKKTLELIKSVGFSIIFEGVLIRGGEYQYWIIAQKSS